MPRWMLTLLVASGSSLVAAAAAPPSTPLVQSILSGWKTADCVCLGEGHGQQHDSDVRIALVKDPAFAKTVKLIVVESANPVHQDVLDRFILDGSPMTREELAVVWRDASGAEVWESPTYEAFFRAVREVNLGLPRDQRIRVIGGDSPIDWNHIKRAEDLVPLVNRGGNIRKIIAEHVLDKHVKALAVYGALHCVKYGGGFPGELSGKYPGRIWSVFSFFGDQAAQEGKRTFGLGDKPAVVPITGTAWAAKPVGAMFPGAATDATLGDVADAILYFGDVRDVVVPADTKILQEKYGTELARRRVLVQEALQLWMKRPK